MSAGWVLNGYKRRDFDSSLLLHPTSGQCSSKRCDRSKKSTEPMSHQKGIEAERATEAELAALAKGLLAPTTTRSEMSQVWEKLKSFADPHWPRAARCTDTGTKNHFFFRMGLFPGRDVRVNGKSRADWLYGFLCGKDEQRRE